MFREILIFSFRAVEFGMEFTFPKLLSYKLEYFLLDRYREELFFLLFFVLLFTFVIYKIKNKMGKNVIVVWFFRVLLSLMFFLSLYLFLWLTSYLFNPVIFFVLLSFVIYKIKNKMGKNVIVVWFFRVLLSLMFFLSLYSLFFTFFYIAVI